MPPAQNPEKPKHAAPDMQMLDVIEIEQQQLRAKLSRTPRDNGHELAIWIAECLRITLIARCQAPHEDVSLHVFRLCRVSPKTLIHSSQENKKHHPTHTHHLCDRNPNMVALGDYTPHAPQTRYSTK